MEIDEGHPVHYSAVQRGTRVFASDGTEVGRVEQIVDNYREHILDGFVIKLTGGEVVFADGPEVARTAERAVILEIDAEAVAALPAPEQGSPAYRPSRGGRLSRLLGGSWRRH